ncbi:MAG: CoB--CoM heterodisulfide reductase iron-sulfur subunit B family protein [bacterium]
MKYAYYPGCSLHGTAKEYDLSTQAVCQLLEIELEEVPGWTCCGATSAHSIDRLLSIVLAAKNLLEVQKMNEQMLICCAACYNRHRIANKVMQENGEERKMVNEVLEGEYEGKVKVRHLLDILINDYRLEKIKEKMKKELKGLRVASYYGCLLNRPPDIVAFDDPEDPVSLDKIVEITGATPVDWSYKTECCGASFSLNRAEIVIRLSHDILKTAKEEEADCLTVACPLCHANLDMRQQQMGKQYQEELNLPVLFFTQLLGLAGEIPLRYLGLDKHMVDPMPLLKKKGIV